MEPLLSVVCITYNHEKYIRQCLDGILMQKTNFPFEIVISDDVSKDETHNIIKTYANNVLNVEIRDVSPSNNLGVINNWRHAHDCIRGKYVAYCEGDDYWIDDNKLQKQVDYLESHPECGMCITDFRIQVDTQSAKSKPAFGSLSFPKPIIFQEHLFNAGYIGPMTWVYRAELFRGFNYSEMNLTDASFALALDYFATSKVVYLDDVTSVYRTHSGSAANQGDNKKEFIYNRGVFNTQVEYAMKYNIKKQDLVRLKIQGYTGLILCALAADNMKFVDEALAFFRLQGMEMSWFVQNCKEYVWYRKQYEKVSKSRAYRYGKLLLKPIKKVRGSGSNCK